MRQQNRLSNPGHLPHPRSVGGLAIVCPVTSTIKPYPFTLPVNAGDKQGAVLVDWVKSVDWAARSAEFHSKASGPLLTKVRRYVAALLQIPINR